MKKLGTYVFEKLVKNEFGEEWIALPETDKAYKLIDGVVKDIPKAENTNMHIHTHEVARRKGSKQYIAIIYGGQNGNGEWTTYISQIKYLFDNFKKYGRMWLIDMFNDCLDDVWYMRLSFTIKEDNE